MFILPCKPYQIEAIEERWGRYGRETRLYVHEEGVVETGVRPETVLRAVARACGTSLAAVRCLMRGIAHFRHSQPLVLGPGVSFMALQSRLPRVKTDSTLAYVNVAYPLTVQRLPENREIVLASGGRIPALWQLQALTRHWQDSRCAYAALMNDWEEAFRRAKEQEHLIKPLH